MKKLILITFCVAMVSCKKSNENLSVYHFSYTVKETVQIDSVDLRILIKNPESHLYKKEVVGFSDNYSWKNLDCKRWVVDSVMLPTYITPQNANNEIRRLIKEKSWDGSY